MAIGLTINGVLFNYPQTSDQSWGSDATDWAQAVTSGMLQKQGGLFTLLNDVNFGPTYGLQSVYYKSLQSVIAQSGVLRLANTDLVAWRNTTNGTDLTLGINGSNQLVFNGIPISSGTTAFSVANTTTVGLALTSGTLTGTVLGSSLTDANINGTAAINYSKLFLSNSIINTDISAIANISVSKLSALGSNLVVITNSLGQLSVGTTTATQLTYLDATSSIQTQLNSKLGLSGGTVTGEIFYNGTPSTGSSLVNKTYVLAAIGSAGGGTGSVVSVATGAGLTGGPITNSGTISIASAGVTYGMIQNVTAGKLLGNYGTASGSVEEITLGASLTLGSTGTLNVTGLGTGTVTSVATGTGLTGGPITSTGTIAMGTSGVTAGTYAFSNTTIDALGRVTAATAGTPVTSITSGTGLTGGPITSTGTIAMGTSGVTAGTYAFSTVSVDVLGRVLTATAGTPVTSIVTGTGLTGGTITSTGTVAMGTSGVSAGTYQGMVIDSLGRVTSASNQSYGTGNVVGPAVSGNNAIAKYSGTTGTTLVNTSVTIDGTNIINGPGMQNTSADLNLKTLSSGNIVLSPAGHVKLSANYWPSSDGVAGQVLSTDGSGNVIWVAASGGGSVTSVVAGSGLSGGTINSSGTIAIANNGVTYAMIQASVGTNVLLGVSGTASGNYNEIIIGSNLSVTSGTLNATSGGGAVTNIATGTGLTGGPITSTGTIAMGTSGVTAGTYSAATVTVDALGRVTNASNGTFNRQTFLTTGTWTQPTGFDTSCMALIQVWGGGGGGAGIQGGGGGGGYKETWIPLSSLTSTVIATIGTGGTGATSSGTSGGNGGSSSFGTYCIAYGGAGGLSGTGGAGGGWTINSTSRTNDTSGEGYGGSPSGNSNGSNGFYTGGGGASGIGTGGTTGGTGGSSVWGGAGGGGGATSGTDSGGISQFAGNGGTGAINGGTGAIPAGGGGSGDGGTGGLGGHGQIIITVFR